MVMCLAGAILLITLKGHLRKNMEDAFFGFLGLTWMAVSIIVFLRFRLGYWGRVPGRFLLVRRDREPCFRNDCRISAEGFGTRLKAPLRDPGGAAAGMGSGLAS